VLLNMYFHPGWWWSMH